MRTFRILVTAAFASFVVPAVALRAFQLPLDHDEHQFVASAVLIARDGLVPYRDFPYFHLPYLSYLYALPFLFSERLLLTARSVCVVAALGTTLVVWWQSRRALSRLPEVVATVLSLLFVLALVTNPLFAYAAGRAWNHDVAILCALLAAVCIAGSARSARPIADLLLGGALVGLATGVRSTIASVAVALGLAVWVAHRRSVGLGPWRALTFYGLGGVAVALPAVLFLVSASEGFWYGNVTYNLELNPLYREKLAYAVAMSVGQKLDYLMGTVLENPRAKALVIAYLATGVLAAFERRPAAPTGLALTIALCVPVLVWAAFAPTPTWYQYYYATQPFLLVGVLAHLAIVTSWRALLAAFVVAPMLAGAVTGARYLWPFTPAAPASEWTVHRTHQIGVEIARLTGRGKVLTLGPLFVLEGGGTIYPALATGPFQWRTADLVARSEHERLGLLGPADLPRLIADPALDAVLTGVERDPRENLEGPIFEILSDAEWSATDLGSDLTLWQRTYR